MGLSRTVSDINCDFSRKSPFLPPRVFCTSVEGYWRLSKKKLESWGYRVEKEVWQYLQPSGYNTPTWRTDGQTPDDSKDGAYS